MFDYLNKFNSLSDDIKKAVDSDEAVKVIEEIEKKYKVDLASLIMRVTIKEINIESLPLVFFTELGLNQEQSENLATELKEKVFYKIADYLGIKKDFKVNEVKIDSPDNKLKEELAELGKEFDNKESDKNETDDLGDEPYIKEQEFVSDYVKTDYLNKVKNQAEQVVDILKLNLTKEKKENFVSLLEKYFKGVKSKIELRQVFSKSSELGGFGLADQMIDNIFMIVSSFQAEEYQEAKNQTKIDKDILDKINKLGLGTSVGAETKKMLPAGDSDYLLDTHSVDPVNNLKDNYPVEEKIIDKAKIEEIVKKQKEVLEKIEDKRKANDSFLINEDAKFDKFEKEIISEIEEEIRKEEASIKAVEEAKNNLKKETTLSFQSPISKIADIDNSSNKIKMTDVKKVKIMSPVDEIRYLDLVNFRRLSKDSKEALEKIREKIKALESLDYSKMIEGIKAWRQSPVHKLYLKIFLDAGNRGVGVDQIIAELKSYGKEFLSKEELEAIVEFNKTLRF